MAKNLLKLLGGDWRAAIALGDLRKMTRDDSDVRLISEILARANTIVRALGLDPADTTASEIYRALMAIAPKIEQTACFKDSGWVLAEFDGQIISFHPVDIVENYHHQLPLGKQRTSEAKRGLGYEITRRYQEHPSTSKEAVKRVVCEGGICWLED